MCIGYPGPIGLPGSPGHEGMLKNPRCNENCCDPYFFQDWPKPCLNCGIGLVHRQYPGVPFISNVRCDSCDRWRFKDDRVPAHMHDCLCCYDPSTPFPACPHDCRGYLGAEGTVGSSRMIY